MGYSQKRKRTVVDRTEPHWLVAPSHSEAQTSGGHPSGHSLCIEAHEADLLRGKEALAFVLESPEPNLAASCSNPPAGSRGSGLIKWNGGNGGEDVWVDRFDARLLLSELPASFPAQNKAELGSPQSPSSWSDLPSDSEDAFFLSPSEIADIRNIKRRRVLEEARTQRLAALRAAGDDVRDTELADAWGGSDEEPDAAQNALMERTAAHLLASPDRARLAARILANHGADRRFAFMRGRWRRAWVLAQARAGAAAAEEEKKKEKANGLQLMGLGGYGDSDEESEKDKPSVAPDKEQSDEAAKIEARRARAREWAAKRRADTKSSAEDSSTQ